MSWPANYSASFPGQPYTDNTEYVLAAYATSWVQAIQDLQAGIGYGSGASDANPVYSVAFNATYQTVTARIVAIESILQNFANGTIPRLNTNPSNIKPVAGTAFAGNVGLAADAGHQHVGVSSYNGRVGAVTSQVTDTKWPFTQLGDVVFGSETSGQYTLLHTSGASPGNVLTLSGFGTPYWAGAPFSVGDIKITANPQFYDLGWARAEGQNVSRTTYASLANALSLKFSGNFSSGVISGITYVDPAYGASTNQVRFEVGMSVEINGVYSGTITAVNSPTNITVNLTGGHFPSSGANTFTLWPFGNGDGYATFRLPNINSFFPQPLMALIRLTD